MSHLSKNRLPSVRMNDYDHSSVVKYLTDIQAEEANAGFGVCEYTHGVVNTMRYNGGCYSPTQDRIYLVPGTNSDINAEWHYIDCRSGEVVAYTHGATVVGDPYGGASYSPTQDRIYFTPLSQATQAQWHYIDCRTGAVVAYTHGATVVPSAYVNSCYLPSLNRIYFAPLFQAFETHCHYIDCSSGNVVAYEHGMSGLASPFPYLGSTYSPVQDRMYLFPRFQKDSSIWHYIDGKTGSVVGYEHNAPASSGGRIQMVYSPINNRLYFIPECGGSAVTQIQYIDCNNGSVVTQDIPSITNSITYYSGSYSFSSNRIYLTPRTSVNTFNKWVYIDCETGFLVEYIMGSPTNLDSTAYTCSHYSFSNSRLYFVPFTQFLHSSGKAHYIQEYSNQDISRSVTSWPQFNSKSF